MVQFLTLETIPYPKYFDFIKEKFTEAGKEIDDYAIHEILTWTKAHTYYTQFVCNRLFSKSRKALKLQDVQSIKLEIFQELEFLFMNYKNILSRNQWKVLTAIGVEDQVKSVRAQSFTKKYDIPPSTAQQSLEYLIEKELVIKKESKSSTSYAVYDVFLSRWLAYK
jgi:Fic family protein